MGLFGPKKSKEEAAFDKAFAGALKKPNEKTLQELELAAKQYPDGWKGYLLLGFAYELGLGVKYDMQKAADYHRQAKAIASRLGSEFAEMLYFYLSEDNLCRYRTMAERALNIRRIGAAALGIYEPGSTELYSGFHADDSTFWFNIFYRVSTKGDKGIFSSSADAEDVNREVDPFRDVFYAWCEYASCNGKKEQNESTFVPLHNKFNNNNKEFWNELKKTYHLKGQEEKKKAWADFKYTDSWAHVMGHLLIVGDPFLFEKWEEESGKSNVTYGMKELYAGASYGGAALHEYVRMYAASEDDSEFRKLMEDCYEGENLRWNLKMKLLAFANLGDQASASLLGEYFND